MRIRKKPNLIPRMERCAHVQIQEPASLQSRWLDEFPGKDELWLELGCGKGGFTARTAELNPNSLLVAVEKVPDAMVMAMEKVCDMGLNNVRFIDADAMTLPVIFSVGEVDRIYINFCDPWPQKHFAKRRLTSPFFLDIYESILKPGGEIQFKTDNRPLFDYSLETLENEGWALSEVTTDLHADGVKGVMTDYEKRFYEQGVPINRLVAVKDIVR